ncbi:nectin-4-like [Fundulus diaphanus]
MSSLLTRLSLGVLVLQIFVAGIQGESEDVPSKLSVNSVEEKETLLPCKYQPSGNSVVQVTWFKVMPDGSKNQIILAHHKDGQHTFGNWAGRVRFKSKQPTVDPALVIVNTEVSDEGDYICHISTFPSGNFDIVMSLTVWTTPISSLELEVVREGEPYRQVASCRSVARPPPQLSWETELNGQAVNRTSDNGAVSTHYSLHPVRGMNGKKLHCLVWHPIFEQPRRITKELEVHFPPDAEVSGYKEEWHVNMENAALKCTRRGNPEPSLTWTRLGGALPKGAVPHLDGRLVFERPLNTSDEGIYQCVVNNTEGEFKAEVTITLRGTPRGPSKPTNTLMFILGGAAAALLIVMLVLVIIVTCYHKRKNKKLKKELTEKRDEISTLSRQASFRRVNSVSTDAREIMEGIPLRVEGTLRNSLSSLAEQARCRDSRSTVSGGRGGGSPGFDSLGRPAIHNNSQRRRERPLDPVDETRLRVEQYVRNSNRSLQDPHLLSPFLQATSPSVRSAEVVRKMNGNVLIQTNGGSRPGSTIKSYQPPPMSCTFPPVAYDEDEIDEGLGGPASQEHPDDQDSEASSSNLSKNRISPQALNHNPHASYVHKAQIV